MMLGIKPKSVHKCKSKTVSYPLFYHNHQYPILILSQVCQSYKQIKFLNNNDIEFTSSIYAIFMIICHICFCRAYINRECFICIAGNGDRFVV